MLNSKGLYSGIDFNNNAWIYSKTTLDKQFSIKKLILSKQLTKMSYIGSKSTLISVWLNIRCKIS